MKQSFVGEVTHGCSNAKLYECWKNIKSDVIIRTMTDIPITVGKV